jgi:hypothetical protein
MPSATRRAVGARVARVVLLITRQRPQNSFTEHLSFGLTLNRSRIRSDASTVNFVSNQNRDYFHGDVRLDYRLSETWRLDGRYSRACQESVSNPYVATNDIDGLTQSCSPAGAIFPDNFQ